MISPAVSCFIAGMDTNLYNGRISLSRFPA